MQPKDDTFRPLLPQLNPHSTIICRPHVRDLRTLLPLGFVFFASRLVCESSSCFVRRFFPTFGPAKKAQLCQFASLESGPKFARRFNERKKLIDSTCERRPSRQSATDLLGPLFAGAFWPVLGPFSLQISTRISPQVQARANQRHSARRLARFEAAKCRATALCSSVSANENEPQFPGLEQRANSAPENAEQIPTSIAGLSQRHSSGQAVRLRSLPSLRGSLSGQQVQTSGPVHCHWRPVVHCASGRRAAHCAQ